MDTLCHHLMRDSVKQTPKKEALVHGSARLSYAEIDDLTSRFANGLRALGLNRGDRVGIYLEKSVNEVLSIFSISKAGGVFVPVNNLLFPDQVGHIIRDCGVRVVVTSQKKLQAIKEILEGSPSVEFVVTTEDDGPPQETVCFQRAIKAAALKELLGSGASRPPQDGGISKDLASILYTSGSTGKPKGVMLSHANLLAGARIVATYLKITGQERILSILPFSFDYGLNQLLTAFQEGGALVLLNFKFPDDIVKALIQEEITGLAGVPPLWCLLTQPRSTFHKNQFPRLRYITNSGGAMPQEVLGVLRQVLTRTEIFLMYGLTEAFRSTYLPPEELERRPTSMGKAIPDCEILVVNEEGKLCKPGEAGELVHRGPTVSMGYWGQPEITRKVLRRNPFQPPEAVVDELVCYSGDLVKMDEDGFLYFIGRRDTMIKCSGFRISPTEVEEVIFSSGAVRGAAVIGVPDEVMGQHIKAFVVPSGAGNFDANELVAFCAQKMPQYMVPKEVEVLEELPKTSSGKVDYPALRRRVTV